MKTSLLLVAITFSSSIFSDCSCESKGQDTVISTRSNNGKVVAMRFEANPVTKRVKEATVCVAPAAALTQAKLWMPEHGHGGGPTQLLQETSTCARVTKISFVMLGAWEIQLGFEGNDKAIVGVEVK